MKLLKLVGANCCHLLIFVKVHWNLISWFSCMRKELLSIRWGCLLISKGTNEFHENLWNFIKFIWPLKWNTCTCIYFWLLYLISFNYILFLIKMTLISPKSTMFTLIIQSCIVNMSNTCIKPQMNLNYDWKKNKKRKKLFPWMELPSAIETNKNCFKNIKSLTFQFSFT